MALEQSLPRSAEQYARAQRLEIQAAVAAVRRQWRRMGTEFDATYSGIEGSLNAIVTTAQSRVVSGAVDYIPAVLEETGQVRAVEPHAHAVTQALVGVAGDGRPVESLLYGGVTHAKAMVGSGLAPAEALASSSQWLQTAVATLLSDTGRSAEKLGMYVRPVTGYVRMLQPPSCGRCAILAGKRERTDVAFLRHPKCDCRSIPASESVAGDLTVDPRAHLDGLDDRALTKALGSQANAAAYRDGADLNQLINAYRKTGGVTSAQLFGRNVKYTTEAVTKRGVYGKAARAAGREAAPRIMPETIARIATSPEDRMRLLRLYGWVV